VRAAVSSADQAASSLAIKAGLQKLTLQSAAGLISADTNFAIALQKNPTNSQALVLKTGTELFILQQNPQFITLLTQIGAMEPNGSIYGYDYQLPLDMDGNPTVATNSRTEQILFYGTNTLRPAIDQAIGRLEMVSTNVSFTLTADQTSTDAVAVDYGDVKGVLSILYLIKSAIHALDSYNLGAALPDFVKLIQAASTIQDILNAYPALFSSNPNVAERALAKEAFSKANSSYQTASSYIRDQRVEQPAYRNLFSFDTSSTEALAAEEVTRNRFAALATSLSNPAVFPSDTNSSTLLDGKTINLGQFFQTTTSPRAWFSANSFYGNFYTPGTLLDPSLSGIFPGQTHTNLSSLALDYNRLNTYTPWNVTTLAGQAGISGSKDGNGFGAQFAAPSGVAVTANGTVYVADNSSYIIRRLATNGVVTTIAGRPWIWGTSNASGTNALFQSPSGLALDSAGNLYVADSPVIRKIDLAGNVTTYAGQRTVWGSQNGSRTNGATFGWIQGLATDSSGNLYVADTGNQLIRKIASNGTVTTIAGQYGVTGDNDGQGTNALFNWPYGITVGTNGVLLIADTFNNSIRKIAANGTVTTVAGQAGTNGWKDTLAGAVPATNTLFNNPMGIASDTDGNILVSDFGNHLIRRIGTNGVVSTIAGNYFISGSEDGSGQFALFNYPHGVAMDRSGSLIIADYGNSTIRKASTNVVPIVSAPYLSTQETVNVGVGLPFKPLQPGVYGSPTSFGASGLPPGLAINSSTGVISGTPTAPGIYSNVIVTASNGAGSSSTTFTINVGLTPPPVLGANTNSASNEVGLNFIRIPNRKFRIIASGGGKYAGINSDSGSVAFSSDGINWSNSNTVSSPYRDINLSCGVGKWIAAVGDVESLSIISSANEGINWNIINTNGLPQKNNSISESKIINAEENWVFLRRYYTTNNSPTNDIWCSSSSGVTWSKKWDAGRYNSIAYGNGVLIAVGENGSVLRSSDKGVTWNSNNTGVSSSLLDIAYGNGRFVAVGEQGMVIVSTNNGSTWSSQRVDSSDNPNSIESVAFGDGVFVLNRSHFYEWGEDSGSSSKDGFIWTKANPSFPYEVPQFSKVTYGPSGFIGEGLNGETWQSSGTNSPKWRSIPAPSRGVVGSEYSYAFSAKGASSYGAYGLPDGLVLNPSTGQITGKPTVAGKYQVSLYAFNSNGTAQTSVINIMVSNAGNTAVEPLNFAYRYFEVSSDAPFVYPFVFYGGGNYLIYSQDNNSGSDTKVALSSDGLEWRGSTILSGNNKQIRALSYSTNSNTWLGILYGNSGTGADNNWTLSVTKSTNSGTSWSEVDVNPTAGQFMDLNNINLINANGVWLLAGSSSIWEPTQGYQGGVWRSDDNGETWTNVWTGNITPNWSSSGTGVGAMAYGNSTVVAVGSDGLILRSTDQGTTWDASASGVSTSLNGVAFGNNRFVATGQDGTILTSTNNGVSWENQPSGENYIQGIAFGNGLFVLANGSASSDGIVWTEANNSYPYWAPWGGSITYGNAGFITGPNFSQSVGKNTPLINRDSLGRKVIAVGEVSSLTIKTLSDVTQWWPSQGVKTTKLEAASSFTAFGLPPGLSLNSVAQTGTGGGVISGTPTQEGSYNVTVYAANANGAGSYENFTIIVGAGTTPTDSTSAPWIVSVPTNVTAMVPLGGSGTNVSYPAAQIIGAVSTNYSLPSGSYFPVGTNLVTVTATGSDGQTASTNFPVIVTSQPGWKAAVAGGKQYSQIVLAKVLDTNGVPITTPGSLLAVFRGEEVVACADPKTTNGMTTYGLNVGSDQASANGLTYKFFNAQTGEISTLAESLNFRSNQTQGTPINPIVLNVPSKTTIALKRGWNWVSFNVLPVDGTIESLLKDYSPGENDVIKGTDGLATYSGGAWYPSPANFKIQSGNMYMLSTKAEGALQISGLPSSTNTLSLKSGWNWIGSPLRNAVAVDHVLNKINPGENDTILAQPGNPKGGFATFSQSNWFLYADEFLIEPGKGYLLYITSPQSITF
jgi:hypothetical protein